MNIRENITNYLADKKYIISIYDDYAYFYHLKKLESFSDKKVIITVEEKTITLIGANFKISKITKEELLINGKIKGLEIS